MYVLYQGLSLLSRVGWRKEMFLSVCEMNLAVFQTLFKYYLNEEYRVLFLPDEVLCPNCRMNIVRSKKNAKFVSFFLLTFPNLGSSFLDFLFGILTTANIFFRQTLVNLTLKRINVAFFFCRYSDMHFPFNIFTLICRAFKTLISIS